MILQGWGMVNKLAPYHPAAIGFGRDDARFLHRNGFDTIRLGIIHKGLEPEPGVYNEAYLARIARTARMLQRQGFWVLPSPTTAFPPTTCSCRPSPGRRPLHDKRCGPRPGRAAGRWGRVVREFRGDERILGYNIFNEPWPGSQWPSCGSPAGCPAPDALLSALTQQSALVRAIVALGTVCIVAFAIAYAAKTGDKSPASTYDARAPARATPHNVDAQTNVDAKTVVIGSYDVTDPIQIMEGLELAVVGTPISVKTASFTDNPDLPADKLEIARTFGEYTQFTVDISQYLKGSAPDRLLVRTQDPEVVDAIKVGHRQLLMLWRGESIYTGGWLTGVPAVGDVSPSGDVLTAAGVETSLNELRSAGDSAP